MSAVLISIHIGAPLVNGMPGFSWPGTVIDYFLAMAHRINGAPYPFLWSRPWEYQIGGLTWLIALCGILMTATAISARNEARTKAPLLIASGPLVTALFRGRRRVFGNPDVARNRCLAGQRQLAGRRTP